MKLSIFSDLHIKGPRDPLYRGLLNCLEVAQSGDQVVFNGDIFDIYLDKEHFRRKYAALTAALQTASQRGVKFYSLQGNHDFQWQDSVVELYPKKLLLEWQGKRFHIEHGDLVDSGDHGYRFLYWFFRSALARFCFWLIPGVWMDGIGSFASDLSRRFNAEKLEDCPPAMVERIRQLFRQHAHHVLSQGADYVIMGHCHDLDEKKWTDMPGRHYINMGYPPVHGYFLSWQAGDDQIQRIPFPV